MNPIHRIGLLLIIGLTLFSVLPLAGQNTQGHSEYLAETETESPSISTTQGLYWVLETQGAEAPYTVVHFYTAQDEKIYESRYEGIILDIADRQTRLMMDELATFVKNRVWEP